MQPADVERIVQAYGAVLEERAAMGIVRDIGSLPYPKDQIKAALRVALKVTSDPTLRSHFRTGYVSLADFQALSDDEIRILQQWNKVVSNVSREAPTTGQPDSAKMLAAIGEQATEIMARVSTEAGALAQELQAEGIS